ncbi:MAG: hypothetical protein QM487_12275, partial [Candidatus Marithrix sp.]
VEIKIPNKDDQIYEANMEQLSSQDSIHFVVTELKEVESVKEIENISEEVEKYGKISPILYNKMIAGHSDEKFPVKLWLAVTEEKVDKSKFDAQELQKTPQSLINYRQQNQNAQSNLRNLLKQKLQIEVQAESDIVPALYLELTSNQIQELNQWGEIGGIFLHETEGFDDKESIQVENISEEGDIPFTIITEIPENLEVVGVQQFIVIREKAHFDSFWVDSFWHKFPDFLFTDSLEEKKLAIPNETPVIDFNQEMMIAVFLSFFSSDGFRIDIKHIVETNDSIIVIVRISIPDYNDPSVGLTDGYVYPHQIIKLKKSHKLVLFNTIIEVSPSWPPN